MTSNLMSDLPTIDPGALAAVTGGTRLDETDPEAAISKSEDAAQVNAMPGCKAKFGNKRRADGRFEWLICANAVGDARRKLLSSDRPPTAFAPRRKKP